MPGTSKRFSTAPGWWTSRCITSPNMRRLPASPIPTGMSMVMATKPDALAVDLPEAVWSAAVRTLEGARTATLVCHVAPDGDALGSMLALARVLRSRGTEVTCTWGDATWAVPPSYRWLPDIDTVVAPSQVSHEPDVLVVLDTASRDRLGVLGDVADAAHELVVIDHHAHNSGLSGVQLIDPAAAATAVLVEELVRRLAPSIDVDTATLLYVGLVTDTGSFQHPVTTPAGAAGAARFLGRGGGPSPILRPPWGTRAVCFKTVVG